MAVTHVWRRCHSYKRPVPVAGFCRTRGASLGHGQASCYSCADTSPTPPHPTPPHPPFCSAPCQVSDDDILLALKGVKVLAGVVGA
jgi:hypothetical protein